MIKNIIVLIGFLTFTGCNGKQDHDENLLDIKALGGFKLSPLADSIFMEYVKVYPSEPAYAIFIDKKTGKYEYMLTMAPFYKKVTNVYESGAVNYFVLANNTPVYFYTGLEDFVSSNTADSTFLNLSPNENPEIGEFKNHDSFYSKVDFAKSWSFIHLDTIVYVVKGNSYPFICSPVVKPTIQFMPPDSSQME